MKRITITELLIKLKDKITDGNLPSNIIKTIENMVLCRTEILGGIEYKCKCGDVHTAWNSCHNKSCPICGNLYEEKWLAENHEEIPNVRFAHLIFTLPHELNYVWLGEKKAVTDKVFDAIAETITEIYEHEYGLTPGIKIYIHSWNGEMNIHIHFHVVLTIGGINKSRSWEDKKGNYIIPMEAVLIKYRGKLLYKLRGLKMSGEVPAIKEEILIKLETKKLNVHLCDEYEGNGEHIFRYLAKRLRGGVFKDVRLYQYGRKKVILEYKRAGKWKKRILTEEEVIKRFFYHIPETGQKTVRGYGIFAPSKKKELLKVVELKGYLPVKLKEYKASVICKKCGEEMLPHREIKSRKQEFIEGMIKDGSELSENKIRYISKTVKVEQLKIEFKKVI